MMWKYKQSEVYIVNNLMLCDLIVKLILLMLLVAVLPFLWPSVLFILLFLLAPTSSLDSLHGHPKHRREVIVKRHGVVATDDGRCSKIGMNVLRAGGHAVDASVAAALCLGVVSPASSGLGGGAFMLIRLASGKTQAFDMRETAPMKASEVLKLTKNLKKAI